MLKYALIAGLAMTPVAAYSQQSRCAPHEVVADALSSKYGEGDIAIGVMPNGNVMTLYGNIRSGTWTVTIRNADGLECMSIDGGELIFGNPT